MGKIILGSSSPRRADILEKLKLDFEITPSSYVEPHDQTDFSYAYVEDLAYNKALDVAKKTKEEALVIGADTIVVLDNKILGKPKDSDDAINMLKMLSGKTHQVVTGYAVITSNEKIVECSISNVKFNELSPDVIKSYVDSGSPLDKAGAYGIQDDFPLVKSYTGELNNIIGLPIQDVKKVLDKILK